MDAKTVALHRGGITAAFRVQLPALVAELDEVEWVAFGPAAALGDLPARVEAVPIELVRGIGGARLPFYDQWQVRRAVRHARLSAFYSPYFDAPAGLGLPTVVTMHDAVHFRYPDLYPLAQRVYYQWLMRWHAAHASAVITDSEFSRRELAEVAGADPRRLHVAPIPLGRAFLDAAVSRAAAGLGADAGPGYALYTGGVEARKNLGRLFAAWEMWSRRRAAIPQLVLSGEPARYRAVGDAAERLAAAGLARFAGPLAEADLVRLYQGARFVVYPSLYEGFGLPVVEAQAVGVPVACSRSASLPEVGGDAALYFDPESVDDMLRVFDAIVTGMVPAAAMVARGRERAVRFTPRASALAIASVLRQVVPAT